MRGCALMIVNMDIITTFDQCLSCFRDMDPAQGYCSVVLIKIIASVSLQINMVLHVRRCVNGVRNTYTIPPYVLRIYFDRPKPKWLVRAREQAFTLSCSYHKCPCMSFTRCMWTWTRWCPMLNNAGNCYYELS